MNRILDAEEEARERPVIELAQLAEYRGAEEGESAVLQQHKAWLLQLDHTVFDRIKEHLTRSWG